MVSLFTFSALVAYPFPFLHIYKKSQPATERDTRHTHLQQRFQADFGVARHVGQQIALHHQTRRNCRDNAHKLKPLMVVMVMERGEEINTRYKSENRLRSSNDGHKRKHQIFKWWHKLVRVIGGRQMLHKPMFGY